MDTFKEQLAYLGDGVDLKSMINGARDHFDAIEDEGIRRKRDTDKKEKNARVRLLHVTCTCMIHSMTHLFLARCNYHLSR